jgi:tRNA (adenine57-N1/adenine58-N1)-methyltransferase
MKVLLFSLLELYLIYLISVLTEILNSFLFIFRETMSFNKYKEIIEENDLVMLYIDFSTIIPIKVTEWTTSKKGNEIENICQTKYGALKVSDLIGKKFGCRVNLMSANGFAHALHPTPELWTKALPHRNE